ncbi:MAG TPA: DUF5667 domain-containing protein [Candidatus Dormibacteraeota bacterium]|nr:DUF5667 domain-containing protein [Candidatus Dormibacteraeota bacterium]
MQRLERLAERLRSVDPFVAPPGAKIRGWNLVLAAVEQSTAARSRAQPFRRLVVGVLAAAVLLVAVALAASADSLPDSPIYPLKAVLESARGALTFSAADKLTYHLDLARTRLTESEAMISRHRADLAGMSLKAFADQLKNAALLVQSERQANAPAAARLQDRLGLAVASDDRQLADLQGQAQTSAAVGAIVQARQQAADALKIAAAPAASPSASPNGSGASLSPSTSAGPASPTSSP